MLPSPLQLRRIEFISVSIVPRTEPNILEPDKIHKTYSFDGARVLTSLSYALADEREDVNHQDFLVTFDLSLPNDGDNPPPYIVGVKCIGYFSISKVAFPDPVKRVDAGVVNGASMLYGAIREMVANITSRSWYGQLLLPSVNLIDHRPSLTVKSGPEQARAPDKSAKKAATKTKKVRNAEEKPARKRKALTSS